MSWLSPPGPGRVLAISIAIPIADVVSGAGVHTLDIAESFVGTLFLMLGLWLFVLLLRSILDREDRKTYL